MRRQSATIWYQGNPHKEIYYKGHYHDKMYRGSELLWEKLPWGGLELLVDTSLMTQYTETEEYVTFIEVGTENGSVHIDWGDDTSTDFIAQSDLWIHKYKDGGEYTIKIDGAPDTIRLYNQYFDTTLLTEEEPSDTNFGALVFGDKDPNNYSFPVNSIGGDPHGDEHFVLPNYDTYNIDARDTLGAMARDQMKMYMMSNGVTHIGGQLPSTTHLFHMDFGMGSVFDNNHATMGVMIPPIVYGKLIPTDTIIKPKDTLLCAQIHNPETIIDSSIFNVSRELLSFRLSGTLASGISGVSRVVEYTLDGRTPALVGKSFCGNPLLTSIPYNIHGGSGAQTDVALAKSIYARIGWGTFTDSAPFDRFISGTGVEYIARDMVAPFLADAEVNSSWFRNMAYGNMDVTSEDIWSGVPTVGSNRAFAYTSHFPRIQSGAVVNEPFSSSVPTAWYK